MDETNKCGSQQAVVDRWMARQPGRLGGPASPVRRNRPKNKLGSISHVIWRCVYIRDILKRRREMMSFEHTHTHTSLPQTRSLLMPKVPNAITTRWTNRVLRGTRATAITPHTSTSDLSGVVWLSSSIITRLDRQVDRAVEIEAPLPHPPFPLFFPRRPPPVRPHVQCHF